MRRVPHTPMRRRIAAHMVESLLHTAPHVTNVFQCDMTAVLADRAARKAEFERRGLSLTLTAYFVAACVDALRAVPEANGRWSEDAILLSERMDIGDRHGARRPRARRSRHPRRGRARPRGHRGRARRPRRKGARRTR